MSQLEIEQTTTTRITVTGADLAAAFDNAAAWARSDDAAGMIIESIAHEGGRDVPEHTIRLYVHPRPPRRGLPE